MTELMTFFQAYGGALALLGSIAVMVLSTKFVTRDHLGSILAERDRRIQSDTARIDELEDRLLRMESNFQHLPDKDVSHRMELAIQEMKGELGMITERLKPVAAISERLQEFLLEQAKVKQ